MTNAIVVKELRKEYGKEKVAVESISLNIPSGTVFAVLGPNGAGKTTLLKMICGLVRPTSGDVWINDFHVLKKQKQAMKQIGVVLEGTRNIYWRLSAWQNLMYFGRLKGTSGKRLKQRAESLLRTFDLWDRRRDEPQEFSRGMQQKLAIACALIADPPILLLDEPTLGLDVQAARTVREQLTQLTAEQGKTVVITSHQLSMVQEISDHIAIVKNGRIITNQATQALINQFGQEKYVLAVEGQIQNLEALKLDTTTSVQVNNDLTTISGVVDDPLVLNTLINTLHQQEKTLLSVQRKQLSLEDIFVELTNT